MSSDISEKITSYLKKKKKNAEIITCQHVLIQELHTRLRTEFDIYVAQVKSRSYATVAGHNSPACESPIDI